MTMLERVARGQCEAWREHMMKHFPGEPLPDGYDALTEREKGFAHIIARAALEALRDPTQSMIAAGDAYIDLGYRDTFGVFRVAIDAALKEQP